MQIDIGLINESERRAYAAGFDSGLNGATITNCHFSIFSTPEKTKAWELGKRDGDAERELNELNNGG